LPDIGFLRFFSADAVFGPVEESSGVTDAFFATAADGVADPFFAGVTDAFFAGAADGGAAAFFGVAEESSGFAAASGDAATGPTGSFSAAPGKVSSR
jgi:hypothetical protein